MKDFKFTKSIMNAETAKTNSKFVQMTDIDRLERIHDNMASMFKPNESISKEPIQTVKQDNTDIFKSRINALNNIKKD